MLRPSLNAKVVKATTITFLTSLFAFSGAVSADSSVNREFQVTVNDMLSVSISVPSTWASGNYSAFLRNRIVISATTNNPGGFTASMTTVASNGRLMNTNTALTSDNYLAPLASSDVLVADFPASRWGYSLNDTNTSSASTTAIYNPVPLLGATPATIMTKNTNGTLSQDVYFGAKSNTARAAGTYKGSVRISVVTGVIDSSSNPITPTNPAGDSTSNNTATYNSTANATSYTTTSTSGSGTNPVTGKKNVTKTDVSVGDTTASYSSPQGVSKVIEVPYTSDDSSDITMAAAGVAATAAVAAGAGIFIAAKKKKDKDKEE